MVDVNKTVADQSIKKIMIVGLPNSGKSQVFNNLTGEYTVVANSPLTTIQLKRTQCRIGDQLYEVIDTPGLYGLYIHSEEELEVRKAIFSEGPDMIIQCIDGNRMKQSLALTADLLSLRLPMVIALNVLDVTMKQGIEGTIKAAIPEITELVDAADDASSTCPYEGGRA